MKIFSNLQNLPNVGEKLEFFLSKLIGGNRIIDLLYHQPLRINQKNFLPHLYEVKSGELIICKAKVEQHFPPSAKGKPFKVRCFSVSGYLTLVFFKTFPGYIEKNFAIGTEIAVSGALERFNDELQISHPEYVFAAASIDKIPKFEVIYPSISAFSQKFLRSKISRTLEEITDFPEWINKELLKKEDWQSWKNSILNLHQKDDEKSKRRLAFDELLSGQIANLIAKKYLKSKGGLALNLPLNFYENLRQNLISSLSFKLTDGQMKVLAEIDRDLTSEKKMLRLLQGDVGSGKTIVAFLAMLLAVENKKQAAILCPITLLAIQHHKNFSIWAEKIGIKIAILTSKITKKNKQKILEDLKNGKIDILIGTHSILEPEVIFKDLAIAVIDEQHRFGVEQRMRLVEKGGKVDVLLMSATPIPRSLMMTFYGDMDISFLNEKPQNRLPIDTRIISKNKDEEILESLSKSIKNGEKIYWICPLIDEMENSELEADDKENEESDLSNVYQRFEHFGKLFGEEKVGLIHGRMKEKEKDLAMENFMNGQTQILVATTAIEVGIDVRDATIIVIENCEQFGLSQLHQLRGRVGRGEKASFCILLYGKKLGINGRKRLSIMKNSNDGFFIAEEDLKLRGGGEMAGKRQSGLPEYKIANLDRDLDLLEIARRQAKFLLENQGKEIDKEALRILLRIFNYDECIKLVFGG